MLYTKQVNHTDTMSTTFTDTVQIDETWEIPTNLDEALYQVNVSLESLGFGGGDFTDDNEWAAEMAVHGILEGKTPDEIAKAISDEWEPSDAEIMAGNSCGTKWHDGL
jgi:hypothetical protein